MAVISWNRAGKAACLEALEMTIRPDFNGSCRASSVHRLNSGNLPRNNMPLCSSEFLRILGVNHHRPERHCYRNGVVS